MKKRTLLLLILFVIVLLSISCFILDLIQDTQGKEISSLKSKIVPFEFTIVKKDNYMQVEYSFLDLTANKFQSKTETIRGNELFIDCVVKKFNNDVKVVFPIILYSNVIPSREGIKIVNDYNNNGFPEIFRGVTTKEKKKISKLYAEVLEEVNDMEAFRSSPHIMANDKVERYQLVARIRGGLEINKVEKTEK